MGHAPAVRAVAEAQRLCVLAALQGTRLEGVPVLSAAAPFRAGGRAGPTSYTDIPAGRLLARHLNELYPFANELRAVSITGAALRRWMARTASVFSRIEPGAQDAPLLADGARSYLLDMIAGVQAEFDLSRPAEDPARVRRLTFAGSEIAPDARFVLATNTHRLAAAEDPGELIPLPPIASRDTLDTLVAQAPLDPDPAPAFTFAPMPGTTAILDTAPEARDILEEIAAFSPEAAGTSPEGFLRLRLHL
ncbi:hypothetical protein DRV85_06000 [Rhodosalinus halophilus]|uniref:5'-Nucleotidase C-terminal domain-containing protein n=1 Tax=Rhodosalinus halophilus TaxID=2259333 RepID=A0A365UD46_9RHOB|nr:hypothetical protein DRV85_06000 [Rhodosalinus halophilus]